MSPFAPLHMVNTLYDSQGRVGGVWDLNGSSQTFSSSAYLYDNLNRATLTSETNVYLGSIVALTPTYNAAGQRTQLATKIGTTNDLVNNYTYNSTGSLTRLTQHAAATGNAVAEKRVDFTYDTLGRFDLLTRYADLAGTTSVAWTDYTFDNASRLTYLNTNGPSGDVADYDWNFDEAGRLQTGDYISLYNRSSWAIDYVSYQHDNADQLTSADHTGQVDETYSYDDQGNRIGGGYQTGTFNRLLSDGTYRYLYDNEGNRSCRFVDANANGTFDTADTNITYYGWDHRNRLSC